MNKDDDLLKDIFVSSDFHKSLKRTKQRSKGFSEEEFFKMLDLEIDHLKDSSLYLFFRKNEKSGIKSAFIENFKDNAKEIFSYISEETGLDPKVLEKSFKKGFKRALSKENISIIIPEGETIKGDTLEKRIENETARLVRSCFQEVKKTVRWPEKKGKWLSENYRDFPGAADKHLEKLKKIFLKQFGIETLHGKDAKEFFDSRIGFTGEVASRAEVLKALSASYDRLKGEPKSFLNWYLKKIYILRNFIEKGNSNDRVGGTVTKRSGIIYLDAIQSYRDLYDIAGHELNHIWDPSRRETSVKRSELHHHPDNIKLAQKNPKLRKFLVRDARRYEKKVQQVGQYTKNIGSPAAERMAKLIGPEAAAVWATLYGGKQKESPQKKKRSR